MLGALGGLIVGTAALAKIMSLIYRNQHGESMPWVLFFTLAGMQVFITAVVMTVGSLSAK